MNARHLLITAAALWISAGAAAAQAPPPPETGVSSALAADKQSFICPAGVVSRPALLTQIALNYGLNPYALPPVPADHLGGRFAQPAAGEARLAAWIVVAIDVSTQEAAAAGLTQPQKDALESIHSSLDDYLTSLRGAAPNGLYQMWSNTGISDDDDLVLRFLSPTIEARAISRLELTCSSPAPTPTPTPNPTMPAPDRLTASPLIVAVRGAINDLATPRMDGEAVSSAFEKASQATLAFTDNRVKGEQTIAIDAVVGAGIAISPNDALFGFIHYVQGTTETDASGDDDDAMDIQALSPGLLWRRSSRFGPVAATLGATLYPTFDFAQDAQTERARIFLSDIAIRSGNTYICDAQLPIGPLMLRCRLGASLEYAHVSDAGASTDFATLDDDQYFGVGGDAGLIVGLPGIDFLRPFELSIDYRHIEIVDGAMSDPSRLTAGLTYKIPDAFVSIGLIYVEGENFETFQREESLKFSVGFRY